MRPAPQWTEFKKYPVVSGTIAVAVGVTLASWSGKIDVSGLYETIDIRRGQLWRLLTSALLHANILHLAFNIYWTWVFGSLVEVIFGHVKTFGIFILLALAANGAEYAFLSGGIGLSGIGYGLFGLLWVLSHRDNRFAGGVDKKTVGLFAAWFFACIVLTMMGYPIGNVAHGVGAVTGALLGWAISSSSRQRIAASCAIIVLAGTVLISSTFARPWINLSKDGYDEGKLGYDALVAKHDDEAVRWLKDAVRMQPQTANYWFNLGIAYDRLGRHSEATAAFSRARISNRQTPTTRLRHNIEIVPRTYVVAL